VPSGRSQRESFCAMGRFRSAIGVGFQVRGVVPRAKYLFT